LMMVDQFTKWVECIPLPSQSAEETARAAVNQFFSIAVCNPPTYWSPSGCPVFPGLPNISSAGNPISLPNIIILGVYRFGCPFQVFTDQGRNFESFLFREMCELLHIHKSRTTPYRPSANGDALYPLGKLVDHHQDVFISSLSAR
jgi:hypothetical protein